MHMEDLWFLFIPFFSYLYISEQALSCEGGDSAFIDTRIRTLTQVQNVKTLATSSFSEVLANPVAPLSPGDPNPS